MKKVLRFGCCTLLVLLLGVCLLLEMLIPGCAIVQMLKPEPTTQEKLEVHLGVSFEGTQVLQEWDTHGGFLGDGDWFVKLSCPDGFEDRLPTAVAADSEDKSTLWCELPLEGEAYTYFYEWGGVFEHPETGERAIPEVASGLWFYRVTGPMNWELAIFDRAEGVFYFYQFDA